MNYRRLLENRRFRFLAAGGWNTMIGCAVFALIYYLFDGRLHYLIIATIAHVIAVFNAWIVYRRFVFASRKPWFAEYLRFNVSSLIILGVQIAGLWILVNYFGFHPVPSQIALVLFIVMFSYVLHLKFTF
jgi:putative flippase GtrA